MHKSKYSNSPSYRQARRALIVHYLMAAVLLLIGFVAILES